MQLGRWAKGSRVYDWAKVEIRPLKDSGKGYWLLARRSLANPGALAYYVCYGPEGTTLEELAWVEGPGGPSRNALRRPRDRACPREGGGGLGPNRGQEVGWLVPSHHLGEAGAGVPGGDQASGDGTRRKGGCYGPNKELIPLTAPGNCSDLMCPSYSQPVIPGPVSSMGQALTRNPETFTTSNGHYHWHFWIPACGDLCVSFRDSSESENPKCAQIRETPSP